MVDDFHAGLLHTLDSGVDSIESGAPTVPVQLPPITLLPEGVERCSSHIMAPRRRKDHPTRELEVERLDGGRPPSSGNFVSSRVALCREPRERLEGTDAYIATTQQNLSRPAGQTPVSPDQT